MSEGESIDNGAEPVEHNPVEHSPMEHSPVEPTPAYNNSDAAPTYTGNMDVIKGITVTLSMELGRTRLTIGELLQLNQGSIIELNRMVDEHMDVLVNGTLIAHGEVVVIDDKFGLRLTDIINPMEMVNKLN